MSTSFTPILQRAVERIPGAVGAVFADWDGEAIDRWPVADDQDLLIMAAHQGVLLALVQRMMHLYHFGEAHEILLHHERRDVLIRTIGKGYFICLLVDGHVHLGTALRAIDDAVAALSSEM